MNLGKAQRLRTHTIASNTKFIAMQYIAKTRLLQAIEIHQLDTAWADYVLELIAGTSCHLRMVQMPFECLIDVLKAKPTDSVRFERYKNSAFQLEDRAFFLEEAPENHVIEALARSCPQLDVVWHDHQLFGDPPLINDAEDYHDFPPMPLLLAATSLCISEDLVEALARSDAIQWTESRIRDFSVIDRWNEDDRHELLEQQCSILSKLQDCRRVKLAMSQAGFDIAEAEGALLPVNVQHLTCDGTGITAVKLESALSELTSWLAASARAHALSLRKVEVIVDLERLAKDLQLEEDHEYGDGWEEPKIEDLLDTHPERVLRYPWDPLSERFEEDDIIEEDFNEYAQVEWRCAIDERLAGLRSALNGLGALLLIYRTEE